MRRINSKTIENAVRRLSKRANFCLRKDVRSRLVSALKKETDKRAKKILKAVIENYTIAEKEKLAVCQDTGMAVVFLEIGQGVHISGGSLNSAVNAGIASGYKEGFLRDSIVKDPLNRGKPSFSPAVIHTDIVRGDKIRITVLPKGFGCENKSSVMMFNPTAGQSEIKGFILDTVKKAGPDACPPFVVGVGIGGTQDYACLLAKKALLSKLTRQLSNLEENLLKEINSLNIGPMGLGGKTTCLGVRIESYPTHIAGLPVAVNISCHALRSAAGVI